MLIEVDVELRTMRGRFRNDRGITSFETVAPSYQVHGYAHQ